MPSPSASIIVPVLKQVDAWLEQAVLSALRQTVPCETIVVTSPRAPDSNLAVLGSLQSSHPALRVLKQSEGTGFAAALNLGIRNAASSRVGFLMSDDWLEPNAVESCLTEGADIVSTGRVFYAADGQTRLVELQQDHTDQAYRKLSRPADQANFLGHFLLFQKAALERVRGVDESLGNSPGVDDFDLIWCLLEKGASVAIVPRLCYNYRDHEADRLTKHDLAAMSQTFLRILDKHGVTGAERERLWRQHSSWFGVSLWTRYRQISPQRDLSGFAATLQRIYRRMVPFQTRIAVHERLVVPVASAFSRKPQGAGAPPHS